MRVLFLIICLSVGFTSLVNAQMAFEKFGKNRVQYKKYYWRNLSTINFDVYYYDNGARLANFATRFLETEFDKITEILGYTPYAKAKIFIYNSIGDLQQSNVGIDANPVSVGGQTDFFKSLVEIPFTGSEVDFKRELRYGVAQMLIREMLFGGSFKDMLQTSILGNFSEWFVLGAAAYVAEGWSEQMDDYMRDFFAIKRLRKPNLLTGRDAMLAGQSMWNFISEKYGTSNISNILNLARIIRNEKNSILNTLGIRYNTLIKEWERYYKAIVEETKDNTEEAAYDFRLKKRNPKNFTYNQLVFSPDGNRIAYSENANGKYKIFVQDLRTKKRKKITRTGYKAINQRYDEGIPTLSWRDNNHLGIMYVRRGETRLSVFNMRRKVQYMRDWFYFNHITSFDFSDDGNFLVISGDRKGEADTKTGQNDIYLFNLEESTQKQLTEDWYDDLNPVFMPNSNQAVLFSSNRTEDSIMTTLLKERGNYDEELNNFDLFLYNPLESPNYVKRLTNSPNKDLEPKFIDPVTIIYSNDDNGIYQLKRLDLKTGAVRTLTNHFQGIRSFDVNSLDNELAYLSIRKGKYYPYFKRNFDFNTTIVSGFQTARMKLLGENQIGTYNITPDKPVMNVVDSSLIDPKNIQEEYGEGEVDTDNYQFEADILKEKQSGLDKAQNEMLNTVKKVREDEIRVKGPYDYIPRFRIENSVTSFMVDPLRGFGILLTLTTSDLLENHKLRGGFFMITDLKNSDFFGEYNYYARRFDFSARFDRKVFFFNNNNDITQRYTMNKGSVTVSFPFTNLMRLSLSPFYANTLWTDLIVIPVKDHRISYSGGKVEFVYDNTIINGANMMSGTRIKVYYEYYRTLVTNQGFKEQIAEPFGIKNRDLDFDKFKIDARKYIPLHKDLIFATRITYGRFGGRSPKSFMVGGVDNWFFNRTGNGGGDFNPLTTGLLIDNSDILFHEFITSLRGFDFNEIAGNNFFLMNLEVRFPIIKYLFGRRVNNNFLKNLQLVSFYDFGSAWTGISPFNRQNSINTRVIPPQGPFDAVVNDFKNPWLAGYGLGIRSFLLGYYLKLDMAWSVEDFIVSEKPRFYLSFGYDF